MDPAFGRFDMAHLDSGEGIVKLLDYRSHLFHAAGHADFVSMIHDLSNRGDDSRGSAETAFREVFYLVEANRAFLDL